MKRNLMVLMTASLILFTMAGAASATVTPACGLQATCTLEDLGSDRYRVTYVLVNASPSADVIFKWNISSPGVSKDWTAVSFSAPAGWNGSFSGGKLDFETPNGSGKTPRLHSPSAAVCGGLTTLTFSWTFDRGDGPVPDCGTLSGDDFKVHTQAVDVSTCTNVGTSFVCTNVVPTVPLTWGGIKALYRD